MRRPERRRVAAALALLLLFSPATLVDGAARAPEERSRSASDLRLLLLPPLGKERARGWSSPPALGAEAAAWLARPLGLLRSRQADLGERFKRHDPPLSIDLTFHLLRQMLEISRAQNQRAQAKQNRLLLDSVGK